MLAVDWLGAVADEAAFIESARLLVNITALSATTATRLAANFVVVFMVIPCVWLASAAASGLDIASFRDGSIMFLVRMKFCAAKHKFEANLSEIEKSAVPGSRAMASRVVRDCMWQGAVRVRGRRLARLRQ